MNFIDNIEIKNFKSIRHQKIEGCKKINVFIGYPNVGKSNILEALSLFSIDDRSPDFLSFIRIENLTTLFFNGDIEKKAEIKINNKHRFIAKFQKNSVVFKQQFERNGTSFEKADTGMMFLDDSNDVSGKKSFELGESKDKKIYNYSIVAIGKENELANFRRYDFDKNTPYSTTGVYTLAYPHGENIFSVISSNSSIRKEVEELFRPYNLELLYDTREQKFTILKRTNTGIFSIPYELVADTLQRLVFYKSAIKSNQDCVLLFEEPEAHMFPPYIKKLTTDILLDKTNQFFLATHSPYVLDELILDAGDDLSVYLVDYKDGETIIHYLSSDDLSEIRQYGVDLFFNIESYLKHGQVNNS